MAINSASGKIYGTLVGDSKWHKIILPFLERATIIKTHHKEPLSVTLFEWQNLSSILFAYGQDTTSSILSHIDEMLKTHFSYIEHDYVSIDKIVLVSKYKGLEEHTSCIEKFFEECLDFGASISPSPVYIGLKSGSSLLEKCPVTAFNQALVALFETKSSYTQRNTFFSQDLSVIKDLQNQIELSSYFLGAIHNNRLLLAFQPVIDAKTGKVESYEALLRILTEDGQIITAGPFIPSAEKLGFIKKIDMFVLKAVVRELGLDPTVKIAMNVSNMVVRDQNWYIEAKALLTDPSMARRLILEITETGVNYDLTSIAKFVENMKALGCEVAIDDFGAGYTSFKQLKLINVDILKIDGAFIRDIIENPESKLFVNMLLNFAKAYNLKTVAEFVETGEIAKILMDLGVDYLQGFYFSKALNYRPWIKEDKII
jgi:EAL domain-containing protein (putative c-di-GMP-specific phosphodiesterase class I)